MQINEAQKKLMEVAQISAGDLPKDYAENHKNIWFAFYAGMAWQEYKSAQQSVQWTLATAWQKLVALFRRQSH